MKKLSLISVFPEEDGMFFHNKVFRTLHSMMREQSVKLCLGISKTRDTLYLYGQESVLKDFVELSDIKTMLDRNIYTHKIEDCTHYETLLARVNHFNPKMKAKRKLAHIQSKFGEADKRLSEGKEAYSDFVNYYQQQLAKQQALTKDSVYFLANKNNQKISLFAKRFMGDPNKMEANTYGFVSRKHLSGD